MDPKLRWLLLMVQSGPWFQSPWRSVGVPGGHSASQGVALHEGLGCSHGSCLLGAAPAEVPAMGLLRQRSLDQACSGGGHWLGTALVKVADLCPVLQRSLAWAC